MPDLPKDYSPICGESCVPLFFSADVTDYWIKEGYRYQMTIVRVEDRRIVAIVQARPEAFSKFLPRAEGVLQTVHWDSGSNRSR